MLEQIDFDGYIDRQGELDQSYALRNTDVLIMLREFLNRPQIRWTASANLLYHQMFVLPDSNVVIARNFTDPDTPFTFALADTASHAEMPTDWSSVLDQLTNAAYADRLNEFFTEKKTFFATDTLTVPMMDHRVEPGTGDDDVLYCWTHSPVSDTTGTFEDFIGKLASRRRRTVRKAMEQWRSDEYVVQQQLLTMDEVLEWAVPNLHKRRRYFDWGHALRQFLIGHFSSVVGVGDMFTVRSRNTGALVACYYYLNSGNARIYQGMVKDESRDTSALGIATLGYAIEHYCGQAGADYVDPTCVTMPFEPPTSIDQYKRSVVTTSAFRPVFLAAFTDEALKTAKAPYFNGQTRDFVNTGEVEWTPDRFEDL